MTGAAAASSIPLITIIDGEIQDDSESGTYINSESNVSIETTAPNKGILPDEGNLPDLTPVPAETTLELQKTASVSKMVTPVHQVNRSAEMNVKRPSLLPGDWKFETKVYTSVATAGAVDGPSETPQSEKQKKSGLKTKEVTSFYFDSENPPESVSWVQMDSSADTWTPFVDGSMVPETQKQEWNAVFSSVSKLKGRNTQTGK